MRRVSALPSRTGSASAEAAATETAANAAATHSAAAAETSKAADKRSPASASAAARARAVARTAPPDHGSAFLAYKSVLIRRDTHTAADQRRGVHLKPHAAALGTAARSAMHQPCGYKKAPATPKNINTPTGKPSPPPSSEEISAGISPLSRTPHTARTPATMPPS